jgi:hypothetical protein
LSSKGILTRDPSALLRWFLKVWQAILGRPEEPEVYSSVAMASFLRGLVDANKAGAWGMEGMNRGEPSSSK